MGRDYPAGASYFHEKCKAAFLKNRHVEDEEQIKMLLERGRFVQKEIEALYALRKYRAMKQRYYDSYEAENLAKRIDQLVRKL